MGMAAPQTLPGMAASLQVLAGCLPACLPACLSVHLSVCVFMITSAPGYSHDVLDPSRRNWLLIEGMCLPNLSLAMLGSDSWQCWGVTATHLYVCLYLA